MVALAFMVALVQGSQRLKWFGFEIKLNQIEVIKGQTVELQVLTVFN